MICVCPNCSHVFEYTELQNEVKLTPPQIYDIIDMCCDHFEVTRTKVFSKDRHQSIVKARHIGMYLVYAENKNGLSLSEVGKYFNADHTTVVHARNRCRDAFDTRMDIFKDLVILSRKADEIISKNHLKVAI